MAAPHILNPAALLEKGLADASPDLMRMLLGTVLNALMSADADAVCGARTAWPVRTGPIPSTATGTATWTPGSARLMWRSPSCGRARTSRNG
jgi:transposase-like protein